MPVPPSRATCHIEPGQSLRRRRPLFRGSGRPGGPAWSRLFLLAGLALSMMLSGCASNASHPPRPQASFPERTCVRAHHVSSLQTSQASATANQDAPFPLAQAAGIPFSNTSIDTARAIGALPELLTLVGSPGSLSAAGSKPTPEQTLAARQTLLARITLTMLDVASVTGEIDCENERSGQLLDRLQKAEEQRLRSLTVTGLVLGAATAILSGGIALVNPDAAAASVVNVVGGTAQAGTGFASLSYAPKGQLLHERNILTDLWDAKPESDMFPAPVWRFLNQVRVENAEMPLRRMLIEQWRANDRLGTPGSTEEQQRIALIFGKGGEYTVEDLRVRDALLDQLEATVKLLYQDLGLLLREVSAWSAIRPD